MDKHMKTILFVLSVTLSGAVCKSVKDATFRETLLSALQKHTAQLSGNTAMDDSTKYAKNNLEDLQKLKTALEAESTMKKSLPVVEQEQGKDFDMSTIYDVILQILNQLVNLATPEPEYHPEDQGDYAGTGTWLNDAECGKPATSSKRNILAELKSLIADMEGRSKRSVQSKVVHGTIADLAEFPFVVYMEMPRGDHNNMCGGSLIRPDWVLTAGHCVDGVVDIGKMFVRVGEHDLVSDAEKSEQIGVKKAIVHPQYDATNYFSNDIALLKLNKSANTGATNINTMCLTDHEFSIKTECIAAGWGRKHPTENVMALKLRRADVLIQPNSKCNYGFDLTDKRMCVGGDGEKESENVCEGDSGGPVFCSQDGGPYYQAGLVSVVSRNKCGDPRYQAIFTKLSKYLDWIQQTINDNDD